MDVHNSVNYTSKYTSTLGVNVTSNSKLYIPQRGVQWKQGVVIYTMLYTSLLCDVTPIHCTPPPTAPPCNEYP